MANPYAPPSARVDDSVNADPAPALWNPNAAANWCLIFTPAFGAFLNMLNWDALGEPERAASSRRWFVASLVMLGVYLVLSVLTAASRAEGMIRLIALIYLFVWYFASARRQIAYVRDQYGKDSAQRLGQAAFDRRRGVDRIRADRRRDRVGFACGRPALNLRARYRSATASLRSLRAR